MFQVLAVINTKHGPREIRDKKLQNLDSMNQLTE
jgi:hypothetical protein